MTEYWIVVVHWADRADTFHGPFDDERMAATWSVFNHVTGQTGHSVEPLVQP